MRDATQAILSTRNLRANLVHPEKVLADELPELVAEEEVDGLDTPIMSPYHRISGKKSDPTALDPAVMSVRSDMHLQGAPCAGSASSSGLQTLICPASSKPCGVE